MTLGELMAKLGAPDPAFEGDVLNDDNVLAIDTSGTQDSPDDDYEVVQENIIGVDAQLNAENKTVQYIRAGASTSKTGTQRTFKITGNRRLGDKFQDFSMSIAMLYGVGEKVVVKYKWFCALNGKGESGKASLLANSDGSGNAGENAAIDIDFQKTGAAPVEYNYVPAGTLGAITVTSVAGVTGKTVVTATPAVPGSMTAMYKTAATVVLPTYDSTLTGWTVFTSGTEYTATATQDFAVAYVDGTGKVKYTGSTKVVVG